MFACAATVDRFRENAAVLRFFFATKKVVQLSALMDDAVEMQVDCLTLFSLWWPIESGISTGLRAASRQSQAKDPGRGDADQRGGTSQADRN